MRVGTYEAADGRCAPRPPGAGARGTRGGRNEHCGRRCRKASRKVKRAITQQWRLSRGSCSRHLAVLVLLLLLRLLLRCAASLLLLVLAVHRRHERP